MDTKPILGVDAFGVRKYEGYINELKLWKIIKELDNYYNNKGSLKTGYGPMPYEECIDNKVLEIISVDKINKASELPVLKYQYYEFKPIKLSLLLRNILSCNSKMKLSYLINELYMYNVNDLEERKLYEKAVNSITFVMSKDPYSLEEKILNKTYADYGKSKVKTLIRKKIEKLPYIREF